MVPEIWTAVTGNHSVSQAATLCGYACFRVKDAEYPGIIATGNPGDRVTGCVYRDLDAQIFRRLDQYEDDFYQRVPVLTGTASNEPLACQTYLVPDARREVLSEQHWDLDWFQKHAQASFIRRLGIQRC